MNAEPSIDSKKPRVVIIGAGFSGLNLAKALSRQPVDVLVIDRTNHHLFQPLVFLIGFRNRAAVLLRWIHAYFTYRKGARIIGAWPAPPPPNP